MKTILKTLAAGAAVWAGTTAVAHANFVPEPSTLPLVGLAIAAAVYVIRRKK
jgi:hypothetical protein